MRNMKFVFASMFFALICIFGAFGMMVVNLLVHDESLSEAINNAPQQMLHSIGDLFLLAWEYKFVTIIALAIVIGILYVRRVPEVKHQ
jgi:uncharacterized membrane protein YgdD (TMEM256/DUF423 family)